MYLTDISMRLVTRATDNNLVFKLTVQKVCSMVELKGNVASTRSILLCYLCANHLHLLLTMLGVQDWEYKLLSHIENIFYPLPLCI